MRFFRIWLTAYLRPGRAFDALRDSPAPQFGLYAVLLRSGIISLLWMLPRALMGLEPSSLPALGFLTPGTYYWHAIWLYPAYELGRWLLMSGLIHLVLRLLGRPCSYDAVLAISGMSALVVEPVVRAWDWIMFVMGWNGDLVFLGVSHIIVAWPWSMALMAIAYKRILRVPPALTLAIAVAVFVLTIPLAAMFLRP